MRRLNYDEIPLIESRLMGAMLPYRKGPIERCHNHELAAIGSALAKWHNVGEKLALVDANNIERLGVDQRIGLGQ